MALLHDVIAGSDTRPFERRRVDRQSVKPTGVVPRGRKHVSDRWAMISVVLGYLGLVAVLALAPTWQHSLSAYQDQPQACTDFGGSR